MVAGELGLSLEKRKNFTTYPKKRELKIMSLGKKLSATFQWIASIPVALFGLLLLFGSPIAGILILLSAVVLMPPMAEQLKNIQGRGLLFPALLLGGLVMFGLAVHEESTKQVEASLAQESAERAEKIRQAELQAKAEAEAKRKKFTEQRDTILAELRRLLEAGNHQAIVEQGVAYEKIDQDVADLVNNARKVLAQRAETERQAHEAAVREKRALETLQRKWHVAQEKSDLDDSLNVYMHVTASNTILGTLNLPVRPKLWIRCAENTTSFLVDWDVYIHIQNSPMTYRIDSQQAQTKSFSVSTDHKALGYFSGRKAIPFIKSLFGAKNLLLQVTPYGKNPAQITFDVSSLAQAIEPLRKACRW
ncbi:MAG: type VI secretion system-associated protein TagO [Candidatus Parabeggiatoa sp.]|nr:type VI secretion system-associated protein TagO [Candidatus Parabeggiatoa sp.]